VTVRDQIGQIVSLSRRLPSRLGFFAALYWRVASALQSQAHTFEHPEWLEELNRAFCGRYFDAVEAYWSDRPGTKAWQIAFEAANSQKLIVAQHLLLGANAHINLDLAVATAQTIKADDMTAFEKDFHKMNDVLGGLVDSTCRSLSKVWPFLAVVNRHLLREEDAVIKFSLRRAREHAWNQAQQLVLLEGGALQAAIEELDAHAENIARRVIQPDQPLHALVEIVRRGQLRSIPRAIDFILDRAR
jgi:hypothetical protein